LRPAPPAQVTARTVLTVIGTILAIALALFLLWQQRTLVRWAVIAIFMAVALSPVVSVVQRGRMPRAVAIPIVYLAPILILTSLGALVIRRSSTGTACSCTRWQSSSRCWLAAIFSASSGGNGSRRGDARC